MLTATLNSELTLPPNVFDFVGSSLAGNISEFASGGGLTPGNNAAGSRLIQADQPILFQFRWDVRGIMTHAFNPAFLWQIEVFLERWGVGEFAFPPGIGRTTLAFGTGSFVPLPAGSGTTSFPGVPNSTDVIIPAGIVPDGLYDAAAVIRLVHPGTLQPCFLAAFAEFGKVEVYTEH